MPNFKITLIGGQNEEIVTQKCHHKFLEVSQDVLTCEVLSCPHKCLVRNPPSRGANSFKIEQEQDGEIILVKENLVNLD